MNPSAAQEPTLEETRAGAWVRTAFVLGGTGALVGVALLALGSVLAHVAPPGTRGWRAASATAALGTWTAWGGVLCIAVGVGAVVAWLVLPRSHAAPRGP